MSQYDLIAGGARPGGQSLVAQRAEAPLPIASLDTESEEALAAPAWRSTLSRTPAPDVVAANASWRALRAAQGSVL